MFISVANCVRLITVLRHWENGTSTLKIIKYAKGAREKKVLKFPEERCFLKKG